MTTDPSRNGPVLPVPVVLDDVASQSDAWQALDCTCLHRGNYHAGRAHRCTIAGCPCTRFTPAPEDQRALS